MRVLVENAKKYFMVETKQIARTRLKYFGILLACIFLSLLLKLLLSKKLE